MINETENAIKGLLHTDAQSLLSDFVGMVGEHGAAVVVQHAMDLVVREDGMRATSRSTSVIGNLVADVRRGVAFGVVRELTEYQNREKDGDPAEWLADRMVHRLTDIVR